jgi:hypothetical protein
VVTVGEGMLSAGGIVGDATADNEEDNNGMSGDLSRFMNHVD